MALGENPRLNLCFVGKGESLLSVQCDCSLTKNYIYMRQMNKRKPNLISLYGYFI